MVMPWLRRLVSGLSPRKLGFNLRPVDVGFVVEKVALVHAFFDYFGFVMPVSFHQCSIPIFIYMLVLPEGPFFHKKQCSFGSRGTLDSVLHSGSSSSS
jgi:hypothetical protein